MLFAALINITSIICFTYLAVYFDKWWIALFASLFMFSTRRR
jgi:predicted secreted protein